MVRTTRCPKCWARRHEKCSQYSLARASIVRYTTSSVKKNIVALQMVPQTNECVYNRESAEASKRRTRRSPLISAGTEQRCFAIVLGFVVAELDLFWGEPFVGGTCLAWGDTPEAVFFYI